MDSASYQCESLTINNYHQQDNSFFSFAAVLAQQSSCSIVFFNADRKVVYFNNRMRSFDVATKRDMQTLDSLCAFFDRAYIDCNVIRDNLRQCFDDHQQKDFICNKKCGDVVKIKLIPVIDGVELKGIIKMAKIIGWVTQDKQIGG